MKFVIDSDAHVSAAAAAEYGDTMGAPVVGCSIAQAMKTWSFPRPDGGGVVVVEYPFVLEQR